MKKRSRRDVAHAAFIFVFLSGTIGQSFADDQNFSPIVISTFGTVAAAPTAPAPGSPAAVAATVVGQLPPILSTSTVAPVTVQMASMTVSPSTIVVSSPAPTAVAVSSAPIPSLVVVSTPTVITTPPSTVPDSSSTPAPIAQPAVSPNVAPLVSGAAVPPTVAPLHSLNDATGSRRLSLDLREMDVVEVLKMLARQNGVNLVIGKNVTGRVTVLLNNVDFWQAFNTILSTHDLAYHKDGDLIEVMTEPDYERAYGTTFSKPTQTEVITLVNAKASNVKISLAPLQSKIGTITTDEATNSLVIEDTPDAIAKMRTMLVQLDVPQEMHVFKLSHASVDELLPKISPLVSKDYGSLQADKRSNTIVMQDNPARIKEVADMIHAFDVRDRAVLIEAKIVQLTLNKSSQWGINWQGVDWSAVVSKLNGYHLAGQVAENLLLVSPSTVANGAVTAPGVTASVGILEKPNFQAVVNFLDTLGTTNLLSSPRVMALNNQEAKIHVGSKVAKITQTLINAGSTTTSPITTENVEFLDVGVQLSVTPSIGDDDTITMKVKPEVSAVENTITTADGSQIPVIRVSEAEASLVVKNGITVVMGGLMEDSKTKTDSEVPFLGRIPLIGMLFRSRDTEDVKTELVIFLTPHIVDGNEVSPEAQERYQLTPDGKPKRKPGFFKRLFGGRSSDDS